MHRSKILQIENNDYSYRWMNFPFSSLYIFFIIRTPIQLRNFCSALLKRNEIKLLFPSFKKTLNLNKFLIGFSFKKRDGWLKKEIIIHQWIFESTFIMVKLWLNSNKLWIIHLELKRGWSFWGCFKWSARKIQKENLWSFKMLNFNFQLSKYSYN